MYKPIRLGLSLALCVASGMVMALPDAVVSKLDYKNGLFTTQITNQGDLPVPGVTLGIRYSLVTKDPVTNANVYTTIATSTVTNGTTLPSCTNGTSTSSVAYTLPVGSNTVEAWVDDINRFSEASETNNKLTKVFTVLSTDPTPTVRITVPIANATVSGNVAMTAVSDLVLPAPGRTIGPVTSYYTLGVGKASHLPTVWNKNYPLSDQTNTKLWTVRTALTDSFNTTTLDSTKWWNTMQYASQGALASNVQPTVNGLNFKMCTLADKTDCTVTGAYTVRGGYIQNKTRVLYGYYETIMKASPIQGNSNVFLYAMDPNNSRTGLTEWTEIDTTEIFAGTAGSRYRHSMNTHLWQSPVTLAYDAGGHVSNQTQYYLPLTDSFANEFHAFGLNWTPTRIEWFLDGVLIRSVPNNSWHQPLDFYIGIWDFQGTVPSNLYSQSMVVQSTKAWTSSIADTSVAGVTFYANGTKVGVEDTATPFNATWNSATVANGKHTLTASARDTAGNNSVSAGVIVNTNNVVEALPDVTVTNVSYDNGIFSAAVTNLGAATPANTLVGVRFTLDGVACSTASPCPTGNIAGPLASGASTVISNVTPFVPTTGIHTVEAFVDDINRFPEANETNNKLSKNITVGTTVNEGFAAVAGVTGGAGGTNYVVTSGANSGTGSLHDYLNRAGKRTVTFKPGLTATISMPPASVSSPYMYLQNGDLTLDGVGANITITGASIGTGGKNNIIIKNMTFKDNIANGSAILISYGTYNVWVDHNTFSGQSSGGTSGQPINVWNHSTTGLDGTALGLTGITLSWNHFKAPNSRGVLVGSESHDTGNSVTISARVSMHHNYYDNITTRNPRAHTKGSIIHEWNSYVKGSWSEAPVTINQGAAYYGQGNIYEPLGTTKQITNNKDFYFPTDVALGIKSEGHYLLNGATITQYGTFPMNRITYAATIETANDALKARIIAGAGANN